MANIMIRKGDKGYVFYVPKRDIEDSIVSMEFDTPEKWGGRSNLAMAASITSTRKRHRHGCRFLCVPDALTVSSESLN